jgi:hypothetical protein
VNVDNILRKGNQTPMLKLILAFALLVASTATLAQAPNPGASGPATGTGYPPGSIAIAASATGTTAATTATLAALTGRLTYICGFSINSTATAAAAGNATVTNTVGGTLNFEMGTGLSPAVVVTSQQFTPCLPASAQNTAIAITSAAPGTGGVISVTAIGYQQ